MEVTFEESMKHLGVESQRQWSDLAIARSTPSLLSLFSIVTLWADQLQKQQLLKIEQTSWYQKQTPAFSDAVAAVRSSIWQKDHFCTSAQNDDMLKIPKPLFKQIVSLLASTA